jgi:NAD(P)-dependent dehydrogenase (short-subunit alcohol dehydrogenase family)
MILANKRVVVTGSSSGIGRSIALYFADQGAKVVINARGSGANGKQALKEVVSSIQGNGGTAVSIAAPIDDPESAKSIIDCCVDHFGGIDILVNNAAILSPSSLGPAGDCPIDEWNQVLQINLNGAFYVTRAALPHMQKQRWGRILNAASYAGTGRMGGSAYSTSKAGLIGFTSALAGDYGPYGITSNVYNPEAQTPMGDNDNPEVYEQMVNYWLTRGYKTPADIRYIEKLGPPEGVAPWLAYLCTEDAANINGQVFALESRRIALLSRFNEERALYHDFAREGALSQERLAELAPIVFPVENPWPALDEASLEKWEQARLFG